MRKALRVLVVMSGIVCAVSAVILGFMYFEDIVSYLKVAKHKLSSKMKSKELKSSED